MCWEIRQHYLPAQAPGRFLLKGKGGWSGLVWGGRRLLEPPVLLSAGFWYQYPSSLLVFYVLGP